MKLKLSEIPEDGLTLSESFNPAAMSLETPDLKFTAPLVVSATFHKARDTVVVAVEAAGRMTLTCARCLAAYPEPYQGQFDLGYEVKGKVALDVTDDIRQEILLSYPVQFLCKESCQGLCSRCGKNMNEGNCSCPPESVGIRKGVFDATTQT